MTRIEQPGNHPCADGREARRAVHVDQTLLDRVCDMLELDATLRPPFQNKLRDIADNFVSERIGAQLDGFPKQQKEEIEKLRCASLRTLKSLSNVSRKLQPRLGGFTRAGAGIDQGLNVKALFLDLAQMRLTAEALRDGSNLNGDGTSAVPGRKPTKTQITKLESLIAAIYRTLTHLQNVDCEYLLAFEQMSRRRFEPGSTSDCATVMRDLADLNEVAGRFLSKFAPRLARPPDVALNLAVVALIELVGEDLGHGLAITWNKGNDLNPAAGSTAMVAIVAFLQGICARTTTTSILNMIQQTEAKGLARRGYEFILDAELAD